MMPAPELHARVAARVAECSAIVRSFQPWGFETPAVEYFDKRLAAGLAIYREHRVEFNLTCLAQNLDHMLEQTIPHEVAHLATFNLAKAGRIPYSAARGHGRHWKGVMRLYFNLDPMRTCPRGAFDVKALGAKRQHRWLYTCACPGRTFNVTTVRHNRMRRGHGYRCPHCMKGLVFADQRVA